MYIFIYYRFCIPTTTSYERLMPIQCAYIGYKWPLIVACACPCSTAIRGVRKNKTHVFTCCTLIS